MDRKKIMYSEYDNCPNLADEDIVLTINLHNDSPDNVIQANFNEVSNLHVLDHQKDYKMSIIRLDMPSYFLPKFEWPATIIPSITLFYPNTNYNIVVPLNLTQVDFAAASQGGNSSNVYYYKQLIQSMNDALLAGFNDIVATQGPLPAGAPSEAPYLIYEPESKLISVICQTQYDDTNADRIEIWMNYELSSYLITLYLEYYGTNQPLGKDQRIKITNEGNNGYDPSTGNDNFLPSFPGYYKLKQEYEITGVWYDLYKILLVAPGMDVRKYKVLTESANGVLSELAVVADFSYDFETSSLSSIRYVPSGEFQWVDLLTDLPMNNINFQLFIELKNGTIKPVILGPGSNMSIKVLFRKK